MTIKAKYFPVQFDVDTFIKEELPLTYAFFDGANNPEYRNDLDALFSFVSNNKDNMPFYAISEDTALHISRSCEQMYEAMAHCLDHLLTSDYDRETLEHFFGETLKKHPYFTNYARKTWDRNHAAVYGRFDLAVSTTGKIKGFYEFNGDTPVMLFESTSLQNNLVSQVTSPENQYNDYFEKMVKNADRYMPQGNVCVVLDYDYIEDICTCETIKQIFEEAGRTVFIASIKDLAVDITEHNKPFMVNDIVVDNLFILSPWEELLEGDNYHAIMRHDNWMNHVHFFEPSWRWFMANKGFLAWMTYLAEDMPEEFGYILELEGFLPTYREKDVFIEHGKEFVGKPLTGRLSSNIVFFDSEGNTLSESDGNYGDDDYIYQLLCKPDQVEGRNNFIMGAWMIPYIQRGTKYDLESEVGTLCIREFDKEILDIKNERFIPHIVEWN